MEWQEALEIVIAKTKHEAYRKACADENPQAEIWRHRMLVKAGQEPHNGNGQEFQFPAQIVSQNEQSSQHGSTDVSNPSLLTQAVNVVGAATRVVTAIATGRDIKVPSHIYTQRTIICKSCEHYDCECDKCKICGCYRLKRELATEKCPIDKWPTWKSNDE
jgi:hypothetical protein